MEVSSCFAFLEPFLLEQIQWKQQTNKILKTWKNIYVLHSLEQADSWSTSFDKNHDTCPENLSRFCEEKSQAPRAESGEAALIVSALTLGHHGIG